MGGFRVSHSSTPRGPVKLGGMDLYILHGDCRSGSAAVELALAAVGAPYELRGVPLEGDRQLSGAHRALNPLGGCRCSCCRTAPW